MERWSVVTPERRGKGKIINRECFRCGREKIDGNQQQMKSKGRGGENIKKKKESKEKKTEEKQKKRKKKKQRAAERTNKSPLNA